MEYGKVPQALTPIQELEDSLRNLRNIKAKAEADKKIARLQGDTRKLQILDMELRARTGGRVVKQISMGAITLRTLEVLSAQMSMPVGRVLDVIVDELLDKTKDENLKREAAEDDNIERLSRNKHRKQE